jgi:hypothetical protein
MMLVFLPLGVLGLTRVPRLVMAAPLATYIALYFAFAYLLPHYVTVIAPPMIFIVLLGRHVLEEAWGAVVRGVQS